MGNWRNPTKTKENDGDMATHLRSHWIDSWKQLHPNDQGYTYDAKQNGMLLGYLRNRLDRILFKDNGNLQLRSCEIIGTEAIPKLTYVKQRKKKKKKKKKYSADTTA